VAAYPRNRSESKQPADGELFAGGIRISAANLCSSFLSRELTLDSRKRIKNCQILQLLESLADLNVRETVEIWREDIFCSGLGSVGIRAFALNGH
jgi:hypothetical protein